MKKKEPIEESKLTLAKIPIQDTRLFYENYTNHENLNSLIMGEIEELQKQEKQKNQLAHDIGALESRKHKLLHLLDEIIEHQETTFESIETNYGKININLETGEYEEIKEEELEQPPLLGRPE